jgi:hypothetical protein
VRLGRDGQRQRPAAFPQLGPEPGDELGVGVAVFQPDAFEVEVESLVALRHDVVDDLADGARGDRLVGQQPMIQPPGQCQQRREDPDAVGAGELPEGLIVAAAKLAAGVDGHPMRRDVVDQVGLRLERLPGGRVVGHVVAQHPATGSGRGCRPHQRNSSQQRRAHDQDERPRQPARRPDPQATEGAGRVTTHVGVADLIHQAWSR